MMTVADQVQYERHRDVRVAQTGSFTALRELCYLILLFGGIGAITWAIRGTAGWDGIDGTILPGLTWGVLWYYVCQRKGIDARGVPLWLGLGIALGGELGYGQYVSWIQGKFYVADEIISIAPWVGYAWFVMCGIGWAAPGGIALGWALGGRASLRVWLVRLLMPLGVALLGRLLIQACPWLFFPNWDQSIYVAKPDDATDPGHAALVQSLVTVAWIVGALLIGASWVLDRKTRLPRELVHSVSVVALLYTILLLIFMVGWLFLPEDDLGMFRGELGKHLGRTVWTNSQNAIVVAWWVGAMLVALVQRDKFTLVAGAIVGGGFGIGFMLSALWCLGYVDYPRYIDWWKMWELNAGFNLGLLYVLTLWWAIRQVDKTHRPDGVPLEAPDARPAASRLSEWCTSIAWAAGVYWFLAFTFRDNAPEMGVGLGLFYVVAVFLATWQADRTRDPSAFAERRGSITLVYSVFLLLFVTFEGATTNVGVLLELYDAGEADQYAWPPGRFKLFVPVAAVIVAATLFKMGQVFWPPRESHGPGRLPIHVADLLAGMAVIGAATIWPTEIGVLYALFLFVALYGFNRLNHRMNEIDASV